MSKTIIQFILLFLALVIAQGVIFNNLVLFSVAVPLVFIYLIISMPVTWNTNVSITIGFLAGMAVDIFSDTLGMNALCTTLLAFMQKGIFHLYVQRDEDLSGQRPSLRTMDTTAYLKYMFSMVLIYCIMIFTVDAFALFSILRYLLCISFSTIYTFLIIYAIATVTSHRHEKRL